MGEIKIKDGMYNMCFKIQTGKYEYRVTSEKGVTIEFPFYYKEPDGDESPAGKHTKYYKIIKVNNNKYLEVFLSNSGSGGYSIYSTYIDYNELYPIVHNIFRDDKKKYKKPSTEKEFSNKFNKIIGQLRNSVDF
jgi:hypothetical protein